MKNKNITYSQAIERLSLEKVIACTGIPETADSHFLQQLIAENHGPLLLLTADQKESERFHGELRSFFDDDQILSFPTAHAIPYNMRSPFGPTQEQRLATLNHLNSGRPWKVCIATTASLFERTLPPKQLFQKTIRLQVGVDVTTENLIQWLHTAGFKSVSAVTEPGNFALRGGIMDIYPLVEENPIRIEFWGDTIDSIRSFDIFKQRTIKALKEVNILPMKEFLPLPEERDEALRKIERHAKEHKLPAKHYELLEHNWSLLQEIDGLEWFQGWFSPLDASLFDYLPAQTSVVYHDYLSFSERQAKEIENYRTHLLRVPEMQRPFASTPDEIIFTDSTLSKIFEASPRIHLKSLPKGIATTHFDCIAQPSVNGDLSLLAQDLSEKEARGYTIILYTETTGQKSRLEELLKEHGILTPTFCISYMKHGFFSPSQKFALYTENQIFDRHNARRFSTKTRNAAPIMNYDALDFGDTVVHVDHGIAKYRGTEMITVGTYQQDCMVLEYKDKARIHVPITDFHKVQKYIGKDAHEPELSKLGSGSWERKKERTRQLLQEMASKMAKLYAKREFHQGLALGTDGAMQEEFENSFLYTPTPDQITSVEAIKMDLESPRPMDRLVCGDVGFGKTEVAMRAAFKAVMDGFQVAILAPTTVLAAQHVHTFRNRMQEFPVTIAELSRLTSSENVRTTLNDIASGNVQIIIGTHKILGSTVKYANLGLVIIDEEQRFGVKQKDKFTLLRHSVNLLSMSATPIPRTLHMSMAGIRDLSLINTPPQNRLPVETTVAESHDALLQEALLRELERGGQAFVVLNQIQGLDHLYARIEQLVPQAKIAIAHGQMEGEKINDIMERFTAGDFDILLSTTIIENGIDIANANTIIVEKADRLGLSQLYQLRGRVGRSVDQGYAFFLVDSFNSVNETSLKRLKALEQYTDLGSGYQLAMRDLELRGAGNLLGTDQSGSIASIGFELYCQMLKEEVERLKDQSGTSHHEIDPEISVGLQGYFPGSYISDSNMRILFYQKVSSFTTIAALKDFEEELVDRFGPQPDEVRNLMLLMALRMYAKRLSLHKVTLKEGLFTLQIGGEALTVQQSVAKLLSLPQVEYKVTYGDRIELQAQLIEGDALNHVQILKNILKQSVNHTLPS